MKTTSLLPLIGVMVIAVACGKYEKNPVPDLQQLRQDGQAQMNQGPEKPQVITKTVVVEKQVPVYKEQATVDENFIVISADSDMNFTEGQAATFQIIGRSLIKGVGIRLVAQNLPAGAVFQAAPTAQEPNLYTLTWTPPYNTVPANTVIKNYKFNISAQITDVASGIDRKALEALKREKQLELRVLKNIAAPTDLAVSLPDAVNEGSVTPFQVTVRVPGVDDKSGQTPKLVISYDRLMMTQGNNYRELDGSRYVIADQAHQDAQYLGDYRWKFSLMFDTQNISVQPPQDVKGQVLTETNVAHVRLNVKAYAPSGSSTPEVTKKVQIILNRPIDAPKFDLSGLGKESLELTPGETVNLNFLITSANAASSLKVDLPNVKTLVGSPSLTCKASAASSAKQECTLSWQVPCAAGENDLAQQINMSAVATSNGRSSEATTYTLKTVRSQKAKAASCATPEVQK
jgi:hypothetical protein